MGGGGDPIPKCSLVYGSKANLDFQEELLDEAMQGVLQELETPSG